MDDEFKLCWKNFQDNIATGFQSLYDRGDLVDVTLACDGKLLQAHKIVLAICSPYFQEIFITNPCKHPIIILKDVSYTIMCELLEFMYQGVVNVKHAELQAFMKIGQLLQIKGLATNSSSSAASSASDKTNLPQIASSENESSVNQDQKIATSPASNAELNMENSEKSDKPPSSTGHSKANTPQRAPSPAISPASPSLNISAVISKANESHNNFHINAISLANKRLSSDYGSDSLSIYSRNKVRRVLMPNDHGSENHEGSEIGANSSSMDHMTNEDFYLPRISMSESRYDINNVKREGLEGHHLHPNGPSSAAASLRNSFNPSMFGLDYSFYKNGGGVGTGGPAASGQEYPNELNTSSDFSKSFANHMEIPPNCPNVVMLSSTSLLHGSCVFNRNNTVATQQGMKTYWLCKSYRISMCRARCITHQGKIISATGVHNHPPHMRGGNGPVGGGGSNSTASLNDSLGHGNAAGGPMGSNPSGPGSLPQQGPGLRFADTMSSTVGGNMFQTPYHAQHLGPAISPATPQHAHPVSGDPTSSPMSATQSNHFSSSMASLQHQAPHHLMAPSTMPNLSVLHTQNNGVSTSMHGGATNSSQGLGSSYTPVSSSSDHTRLSNAPTLLYESPSEKNSTRLHLNDDHIPVHNAAELSPTQHINENNNTTNTHNNSSGEHHSLGGEDMSEQQPSPHHHQPVQVIDSITISPGGNQHSFKMEPL